MRRPTGRTLGILTALVLAGIVAWIWGAQRQPSFEGRTLEEWCDLGISGVDDDNEAITVLASNAVWQIGEQAIPWIVDWTTVGQPKWEAWLDGKTAPRFKGLEDWIEARDKARDQARERAGYLADVLRERAGGAISKLIDPRWINHPDAYIASAETIYRIGPEGISHLAFALTNISREYRSNARHVLNGWGPDAEPAGPIIWRQLDPGDDSQEQEELLRTLAVIHHRPKDTATAISARLKRFSGDEERCTALYTALLEVGPDGAPEFAAGLTTTNLVQRESAIRTLIHHVDQWGMPKLLGLIFASSGSEGKTNCLLYVKDILHGTNGKNWIYDPRSGHPFGLLCALADDADPAVAATAKGLIVEYGGSLDTTLKLYRSRRNLRL